MLSPGCAMCRQGRKSVLFITGLCSRKCFYCPISEQKDRKDVIFINEVPIMKQGQKKVISGGKSELHAKELEFDMWFKELVREIELCKSHGVGITGGDPLMVVDRVCEVIKGLKHRFGEDFHIHLYTPLELFTEENLEKLYEAGLDEIRFHPNVDDDKFWSRGKLAKKFNWTVTMEIPVTPDKELKTYQLIKYMIDYVDFINLNELEYSDTNAQAFKDKYHVKNSLSYGVEGSEEIALDLKRRFMEKGAQYGEKIHYCSAGYKDGVQMRKRIKLRAESIKKDFQVITLDGLIKTGAIYLKDLKPGLDRKLESKDKKLIVARLIKEKEKLDKILAVIIDSKKMRFLCKAGEMKKMKNKIKKLGLVPAVVEEYPTYDGFEVEVDFV